MRRLKAKLAYFTRVARFVEMIFLLGVIQVVAVVDYRINHNLFPSPPFLLLYHPQRNALSHCVQLDYDFHFGVHGF